VFDPNLATEAMKLYVNGSKEGTNNNTSRGGAGTGTPGGSGIHWASIGGSVANYWGDYATDGRIDDTRVYSRALSSTEIAGLVAGGASSTSTKTTVTGANLQVGGNLTLASGKLDAGSYDISVAGSWLNSNGTFLPQSRTVTLNGTASGKTVQSGGQKFNNLTVAGSGGAWTLADRLRVTGSLSISAGTLDVSASNYVVHAGTVNQTGGTFTARSGTVVVDSSSNQTLKVTSSLNNLRVEDPTEDGLLAYWKLDEGWGTTAADSSGTGNTATLVNSPSWSTDLPSGIKFRCKRAVHHYWLG
jgi:hypothetical protein